MVCRVIFGDAGQKKTPEPSPGSGDGTKPKPDANVACIYALPAGMSRTHLGSDRNGAEERTCPAHARREDGLPRGRPSARITRFLPCRFCRDKAASARRIISEGLSPGQCGATPICRAEAATSPSRLPCFFLRLQGEPFFQIAFVVKTGQAAGFALSLQRPPARGNRLRCCWRKALRTEGGDSGTPVLDVEGSWSSGMSPRPDRQTAVAPPSTVRVWPVM